jgi:hypothetical protein
VDESTDIQEQNLSSEDDDFNASQKVNEGGSTILNQNDSTVLKLKGKTKCDKGSASDPQGVYAKVSTISQNIISNNIMFLKCGLNQSDVRSKEILILYNAEKKRKNK